MTFLKKVGIALLVAIITGGLALVIGIKEAKGDFIQWRSLGKPSGQVVRIVGATVWSVTVGTTSNRNYSCEISSEGKCWYENNATISIENKACGLSTELPRPLSNIVEIQKGCYINPGGLTESTYALREDGNIYVWHGSRGLGEGAWIIYLFSSIVGVLIGFVGTFIFFFVRWLINLS